MGRCKPLEKAKKKGLWSPDEDQKLRDYVMNQGHGCWTSVPPDAGLQRNGKSCRLRWINYLRPGLKRGLFTIQEEQTILTLHALLGNKWAQISQHLPGRTDNEIKNYWHCYMKKEVAKHKHLYNHSSTMTTNSSPSMNLENSRNSSFTSLQAMGLEGSLIDSPQQFVQHKSSTSSNMSKVLFADWLCLEQFRGQDSRDLHQQTVASKDSLHDTTNFHDTYVRETLLIDERSFVKHGSNGVQQGPTNDSTDHGNINEEQLKFEDEQLYQFASVVDNLYDFSSDDLMYMYDKNMSS